MTLQQTNSHMPRWIVASLTDWFEDTVNAGITNPPKFDVTGYDLKEGEEDSDRIEMRIQGPYLKDRSGWEVHEVPINFLMTFRQDQVKDPYTLDRWLGIYQEALRKPLLVTRCGNGAGDDDTLIGCLGPKRSKREFLRLDRYGYVKNGVNISQATVGVVLDMWVPWY